MEMLEMIQMVLGGGAVAVVVELGSWWRHRKADKANAEAKVRMSRVVSETISC